MATGACVVLLIGSSLMAAGLYPVLLMEENRLLFIVLLLMYGLRAMFTESGEWSRPLASSISLVALARSYEFSVCSVALCALATTT